MTATAAERISYYKPVDTVHGKAYLWAREGDKALVSYKRERCTDEAMLKRYTGSVWYVMIPEKDILDG